MFSFCEITIPMKFNNIKNHFAGKMLMMIMMLMMMMMKMMIIIIIIIIIITIITITLFITQDVFNESKYYNPNTDTALKLLIKQKLSLDTSFILLFIHTINRPSCCTNLLLFQHCVLKKISS